MVTLVSDTQTAAYINVKKLLSIVLLLEVSLKFDIFEKITNEYEN
tara:strand:- start:242 stop:376 length:135 start_codon:yes stop_codon:yes gene_type:complete